MVVAGRVELEEALAMVIGMGIVARSKGAMLGSVLSKDSALALQATGNGSAGRMCGVTPAPVRETAGFSKDSELQAMSVVEARTCDGACLAKNARCLVFSKDTGVRMGLPQKKRAKKRRCSEMWRKDGE